MSQNNEEKIKIKRKGKTGIIVCTIILIVSAIICVFFLLISIAINEVGSTMPIIITFGILIFTCIYCIYCGKQMIKNPSKFLINTPGSNLHNNRNVLVYEDTTIYRNNGETYGIAQELYCKNLSKKIDELEEDDEEKIWDYAFDDWSYLLAWIIENGHFQYSEEEYGEEDKNNFMEVVSKIKNRIYIPTDFLLMTEGYMYEEEISEEVRDFIEEYLNGSKYNKGHYYLKEGNTIGAYYVELENFAKEELNSKMYGFSFLWEEYDKFKGYINTAYKKYKEGKTS